MSESTCFTDPSRCPSSRALHDKSGRIGVGRFGISKSRVSTLCKDIDERVHAFLDRPLAGPGSWRPTPGCDSHRAPWLPLGAVLAAARPERRWLAPGRRRRNAIQPPGFLQVSDRPRGAHAGDHPPQNGPEIAVYRVVVDGFERIHDDVDLHPGRKRLAAPPNEY